ncbi:ROK family protein [Flavihumibacter petaseus]|uniref:Fructokinase n=1 Tax=Flavihumibacter petaseus NBRC 106054 TaxID=1220578 RepID=A0A0E9MUS8_9BACT|nr:ROK family protein [Flavihumibacter petaseus]GAO41334.1 fructokinase [Flavihumibacter petaseus NBRC 106054]
MQAPIWGIDLGGTKIEGVILPDLDNPQPIIRTRVDTEGVKGYHHIVGQIAKLVEQMKEQSGLQPGAIGIGTPGVLDPRLHTMKNCNSTALNGQPLQADVEKALGIPVVLANDANCFALAETHWGVVKQQHPQARMVFGIIMGTGVGGGLVINGRVWNGLHGIAGEWGHIFLDESGGACYCGKSGCVETILSGPALQRYYQQAGGEPLNLKQIMARTAEGEKPAVEMLDRLHYFFGKGLAMITNMLDPDVIVIGGGVGNIDSLYSKGLQSLEHFIFNNRLDVPVLKPVLGDSAGVFGAAALVAGDQVTGLHG